jgi:hypothetical protein
LVTSAVDSQSVRGVSGEKRATAKVLDFGIAKAVSETTAHSPDLSLVTVEATEARLVVGTAAYMSPEQAAQRKLQLANRHVAWRPQAAVSSQLRIPSPNTQPDHLFSARWSRSVAARRPWPVTSLDRQWRSHQLHREYTKHLGVASVPARSSIALEVLLHLPGLSERDRQPARRVAHECPRVRSTPAAEDELAH